jgi:hypothetical protein
LRGVDVPKNDPDTAVLASLDRLRGAEFGKVPIEQRTLAGKQITQSAFAGWNRLGPRSTVQGRGKKSTAGPSGA